MDRVIILAMHGAPPNDFPREELAEFFDLPARIRRAEGDERSRLRARRQELEAKLAAWPRSAKNDPFWAGSQEVAQALAAATGSPVTVAFNEFCAPTVDDAIDLAAENGAAGIVVTTAMLTRGGDHAESEIPVSVRAAQARHPEASIVYAWPFRSSEIAQFLARQVEELVARRPER